MGCLNVEKTSHANFSDNADLLTTKVFKFKLIRFKVKKKNLLSGWQIYYIRRKELYGGDTIELELRNKFATDKIKALFAGRDFYVLFGFGIDIDNGNMGQAEDIGKKNALIFPKKKIVTTL